MEGPSKEADKGILINIGRREVAYCIWWELRQKTTTASYEQGTRDTFKQVFSVDLEPFKKGSIFTSLYKNKKILRDTHENFGH